MLDDLFCLLEYNRRIWTFLLLTSKFLLFLKQKFEEFLKFAFSIKIFTIFICPLKGWDWWYFLTCIDVVVAVVFSQCNVGIWQEECSSGILFASVQGFRYRHLSDHFVVLSLPVSLPGPWGKMFGRICDFILYEFKEISSELFEIGIILLCSLVIFLLISLSWYVY